MIDQKGFFVSENIVNLSNHKIRKADASLLSKFLKFCPIPNSVDKSVLKEDLEKFGRTLILKWHYFKALINLICYNIHIIN